MQALNAYSRWLIAHPYKTKMVTSGLIFGLSDSIVQKYLDGAEEVDPVRLTKVSSVGALFLAPVLHKWFGTALPAWYKNVL